MIFPIIFAFLSSNTKLSPVLFHYEVGSYSAEEGYIYGLTRTPRDWRAIYSNLACYVTLSKFHLVTFLDRNREEFSPPSTERMEIRRHFSNLVFSYFPYPSSFYRKRDRRFCSFEKLEWTFENLVSPERRGEGYF